MLRERLRGLKQGRYLERGLTWRSAAVAVVVIIVVMIGLGSLARQLQSEYPITATVLDTRVVDGEPTCSWEADIEFRNDTDRSLRLVSVEIAGIDDSKRRLLGTFEPAESIVRTYQYPLEDCTPPSADRLIAVYGPALTRIERSAEITLT